MRSPKRNGLLIAIEGIDGSGTTTQAELLVERLNGAATPGRACLTREPSPGPIGRLLREVLSGQRPTSPEALALLFAADRMDHVRSEIQPRVERGEVVISDRYVYSSLTYQSVQLAEKWVFQINEMAPGPDLTVYLRISAEAAAERRRRRGQEPEIYDETGLQRQIAARYDELLGRSDGDGTWQADDRGVWRRVGAPRSRLGRSVDVALLDGERQIAEIHAQLWALVSAVVNAHEGEPER